MRCATYIYYGRGLVQGYLLLFSERIWHILTLIHQKKWYIYSSNVVLWPETFCTDSTQLPGFANILIVFIFFTAKVMKFSQLLHYLSSSFDANNVLKPLQQVAYLVQGCWVVKRYCRYLSPFWSSKLISQHVIFEDIYLCCRMWKWSPPPTRDKGWYGISNGVWRVG